MGLTDYTDETAPQFEAASCFLGVLPWPQDAFYLMIMYQESKNKMLQ
jgi:hypothetical protein